MRAEQKKAQMAVALGEKPMTYAELVEFSGMTLQTVGRWVRKMRVCGLIHVESWAEDRNGRLFVPRFRWSAVPDTPDVARPGDSRTAAERMAAMRAERKIAKELGLM